MTASKGAKWFSTACGLAVAALFLMMSAAPTSVSAQMDDDWDFKMTPVSDNIVAVSMVASGDDEQALIQNASYRAVMASIGRIYSEDYILIATGILEKYINHQFQKFVISTKIGEKQWIENKPRYEIKVFVNMKKLKQDLVEKQFLAKPRLRPYFDVYLEEKVEGVTATAAIGRQTIVTILDDERGARVNETSANNTPTNLDVLQSDTVLRSSFITAQKNGVELIITGSSHTSLARTEELYYTTYYFYNTEVTLSLIRVDTGEILKVAHAEQLASATSQQEASSLAVRLAVTQGMNDILDYYRANWHVMIGHRGYDELFLDTIGVEKKADYIFMFTGCMGGELESLLTTLNGLGDGAQAYLKNYWHGVAVVALSYEGPRSRIDQFIEANPYPVIHLVQGTDNWFEMQVE